MNSTSFKQMEAPLIATGIIILISYFYVTFSDKKNKTNASK